MAKLIFNIAKKADTLADCVKLKPSTNYSDTILRNTAYSNISQKSILVVNSCETAFTLPSQNLFTDSTNSGNFVASIASKNIPSNTEVSIPVLYNGTFKGVSNSASYTITVNGSTATYGLTINTPDTAPTTSDSTISLANRVNTTVTKSNLTYNDVDGISTVTNVRFTGDTSKLFTDLLRTTQYVSGTELPIDFTLYFKAPDQDAASTYTVNFDIKASGVWSN